MDRIAVLGAGNAGQCIAVDCKLAGKEVRLFEFPEYRRNVEGIKTSRKIRLSGPQSNKKQFKREGLATLDLVTTDIVEAVKGAQILCVSVWATGYEKVFKTLIPLLEDGQVVVLYPDNFGSLMFRKLMRDSGCRKKIIVGGWSSLPYGVRIIELSDTNEVYAGYRAISLRGDTLPSRHRDAFFDAMRHFPIMDSVDMEAGDTILDVDLSNLNPILHVPSTILNAGAIDNWGIIFGDSNVYYDIYKHGFSPHVAKVQFQFYQELCGIAEKVGISIQHFERSDFMSRTSLLGIEFMGKGYSIPFEERIPDDQWAKFLPGERFSLNHRYVTEDIPVGCRVFYELAKAFGADVPVIQSMIALGSVYSDTDYFTKGFSLENLGISGMSRDELLKYLRG